MIDEVKVMNSEDLFKLLKKEAEYFSIEDLVKKHGFDVQEIHHLQGSLKYKSQLIAKYDLEMFFEIKNKDNIDTIEDIDPDVLNDFTFRIDKYMDKNAPDKIDFKRYIRIVSTYLAFIVKKPLHPPGMIFNGDQIIVGRDNNFFCPIKNKWLNLELSLCKYCVCLDISEK